MANSGCVWARPFSNLAATFPCHRSVATRGTQLQPLTYYNASSLKKLLTRVALWHVIALIILLFLDDELIDFSINWSIRLA